MQDERERVVGVRLVEGNGVSVRPEEAGKLYVSSVVLEAPCVCV